MGKIIRGINTARKLAGFRLVNFTGDWSHHVDRFNWIKENLRKGKGKPSLDEVIADEGMNLAGNDTPQGRWELVCHIKQLTEEDVLANKKTLKCQLFINLIAMIVFFAMLVGSVFAGAPSLLYVIMVSMCLIASSLRTLKCWFHVCQINDRALYSFWRWISGKEGC